MEQTLLRYVVLYSHQLPQSALYARALLLLFDLREMEPSMGDAKRRKALGNYPDTTKPRPTAQGAKSDGGGETVAWEVLGNWASHPKSEAVIQLLEKLKREYEGYGGNTMVVTLEKPVRTPIIKARVTGMGAFMGLIGGMQDLGLEDRLENAPGPERGIDAAFS